MLLLLTTAFLLKRYGTQALPLPSPNPTTSTFEAAIFARDDPSDGCDGRTVLDILWSCLATTFACTWVSVHPNVPYKGEGKWTLLGRRIFLMFFSILVPEFMVMWAFKQWRGAVMIREAVNAAFPGSVKPWTTTHGHLLQMGGFRLHATTFENHFFRYFVGPEETYFATVRKRKVDLISSSLIFRPENLHEIWDGIKVQVNGVAGMYNPEELAEEDASRIDFGDDIWEGVLTFEALKQLLSENLIAFPAITEDEIDDKSKGDALSKGFALLQLTWFIVQIITRAAQGLAISELELTTAALAGLNSIMYIFWWSKPRDVRFPFVIRTKGAEELLASRDSDDTWSFSETEFDLGKHLSTSMASSFIGVLTALRSVSITTLGAVKSVLSKLGSAIKVTPHHLHSYLSRVYQYLVTTMRGLKRGRSVETLPTGDEVDSNALRDGDQNSAGEDHDFQTDSSLSNRYTLGVEDIYIALVSIPGAAVYCTARFIAFLFLLTFYIINFAVLIPIAQILDNDAKDSFQIPAFDTVQQVRVFSMMFYSETAGITPLLSTSAIAGAVFGAIHCLAWHFSFPSHAEQVMWRSASLGVVTSCFVTFQTAFFWDAANSGGIGGFWEFVQQTLVLLGVPLCFLASIAYPVARIALLILSITSLRSLPPSAFATIDWVELVPHI